MVKANVSRTQFSLSIAITVALTPNLRKLNFSQISPRMSESFEYVGPAVHLSEDKSTFVTEAVYSKIPLRRLSPKFTLKFTARNSNLKSAKFNLSNVNIGAWLNIATLF